MSNIYVGISGWTYGGWRGKFYPPKLPHREELSFASHELPSIEINGTFYALQRPSSYSRWYDATPAKFIFSVKANRYITHVKKLNDVEIPIANFLATGLLNLEEKLGPILWQFPPSMGCDPERFKRFLELLPQSTFEASQLAKKNTLSKERSSFHVEKNRKLRHAVEIRHPSFLNPEFIKLLKDHNVALVFADTAGKWPYMEDVTANFLYLRLHGDSQLYVSGYDDPSLDFWSKRISLWSQGQEPKDRLTLTDEKTPAKERDVFVYFDNDAKVRAPVDAKSLMQKLSVAQELLH
ncbi:MAG: DUF72 domain-containing protein [Bdellovibrionales bacterium]|nr:DUF72 domain-containing protein [Bdellovibrionales bacterium]